LRLWWALNADKFTSVNRKTADAFLLLMLVANADYGARSRKMVAGGFHIVGTSAPKYQLGAHAIPPGREHLYGLTLLYVLTAAGYSHFRRMYAPSAYNSPGRTLRP
jgi:hypothetical protein